MTRTKKAARRGGGPKSVSKPTSGATAPDAASLIDKAHTLLAQSNFELAAQFLERALELEATNLEARELLGVAHLEAGDPEIGRSHLLQLLPPHAPEAPQSPSPYLYLAQTAAEPQEALGYYTTAVAMLENRLKDRDAKGKSKASGDADEVEEQERDMAVTALVAMIEIWMSDLCMEEAAESSCDNLIGRALSIAPDNPDVRLSLASIRMSQQRFDEAKEVILKLYKDIEGIESFDDALPDLPARLLLSRLLLEHAMHIPALEILGTVREEDALNVEGAYLEGWAFHLRAEALQEEGDPAAANAEGDDEEEGFERLTADECLSESMASLLECAKLFTEQDYVDEGIGKHVAELLEELEKKGVKPAEPEDEEEGAAEGDWEDVQDVQGDVKMA